ncbi:MAG: S9 family peptidase [Planctomycetales bacterium]|nr:S9 family peptidase [Planctomycetales bacterium]
MCANRPRSNKLAGQILRRSVCIAVLVACGLTSTAPGQIGFDPLASVQYPETTRLPVTDDYHGTTVADPYRWLEDPDSAETMAWVEAENRVTNRYLEQIPQREEIRGRLNELWNYERFGLPVRRGETVFYEYNDGLMNQDQLLVVTGDGEPRVLFDPNEITDEGIVDLADWVPSNDGRLIAMAFATAGSDWREWKVLEVESGEMRTDHVRWSKFASATWAADGSGFFYSRFDEPVEGEEFTGSNYFHKVFFHRLGTLQSEDPLVYERADRKDWLFDAEVTDDGHYLCLTVSQGSRSENQFFYRDLSEPESEVVELCVGFDAEYLFIGNEGSTFFFLTDNGAAMRRILAIDLAHPERTAWREVVPEQDFVALSAHLVGGRFAVTYLRDARGVARVYGLDGQWQRDIELPGIGSVVGFDGKADQPETYFAFQGFTTPTTIYRTNVASGETEVYRQAEVPFDPADYETTQHFYESTDGTRVPMFIVRRRDMDSNRPQPTLLYGYGGFDISITPRFSVTNLTWVDRGGVYAVANLRGGGEYGREWHAGGMLDRKQNVFDDFISAAEFLISEGITDREHLGIHGRSNGGLLVGACMCQRPDLFAAAVPGVGVMDMLRFHRFTIGHAWVSEYGSSDDPEQFQNLLSYSPIHNLHEGTRYPATLVMTADHDDRVVPAHSHKFAARLQASQAPNGPPCLIRIETAGGHGAGKPTSMQIAEATDFLAFLSATLGLE